MSVTLVGTLLLEQIFSSVGAASLQRDNGLSSCHLNSPNTPLCIEACISAMLKRHSMRSEVRQRYLVLWKTQVV